MLYEIKPYFGEPYIKSDLCLTASITAIIDLIGGITGHVALSLDEQAAMSIAY